jgi:DNA adenine methylase
LQEKSAFLCERRGHVLSKDKHAAPFVKWAGGKRQIKNEIIPLLPKAITSYCEPFLGGGAILFSIQPVKAIVNDLNAELISVYETIRDNLERLIDALRKHKNTEEYFYAIRELDRDKDSYRLITKVDKAARLLYLNKTCYNGLFRVNSAGEFNSPFGYYKNPNIVNEPVLRAVSSYLNTGSISFFCEDFAETLKRADAESFVYLDPPYDPLSGTANFTGYMKGGFDKSEQIRLKQCCDDLDARGIKFLLSNSATDFIRELYSGYEIAVIEAKRAISADAKKRSAVKELLIRNYGSR